MLSKEDAARIRQSVQRTVGREVLRRLKRMADDDAVLEQEKLHWAWRISLVLAVAFVAAMAWMLFR